MKLINLFLASLTACTLASCSKEDDLPSGPQEVDAYISIAAIPELQTKADTDKGEGKEAAVSKLTALIFNVDGSYYMSKDTALTDTQLGESKSINCIKNIKVKVARPTSGTISATQFKVYLFANADIDNPANLEGLKTTALTQDITTFATIGNHYLPMHSDELTVGGLTSYESGATPIENWYKGNNVSSITEAEGTNVIMTRSISRVEIVSLAAKFDASVIGATFTVKKIYLANVRATANVLGGTNTAAAYYRGAPETFTPSKGLIDPTKEATRSIYLKEYDKALSEMPNTTDFATFKNYMYANTVTSAYQTRLIIEGDYEAYGLAAKTKYFHIPLKDDVAKVQVDGQEVFENVVSNKIYKITATITGEGSDKPDEILNNAYISFKIKVAPWNVINQDEDDTN